MNEYGWGKLFYLLFGNIIIIVIIVNIYKVFTSGSVPRASYISAQVVLKIALRDRPCL